MSQQHWIFALWPVRRDGLWLVAAALIFGALDVVVYGMGGAGPHAALFLQLSVDVSLLFLARFPVKVAAWAVTVAVLMLGSAELAPGLFTSDWALPFATPAIAVNLVRLTERRRAFVLIGLLAVLGTRLWDPSWDITPLGVVNTVLPALAALYLRARGELMDSLRERAERTEREQLLLAEQARAEERRRLAEEMHDVVTHRLSLIVLHAGALGTSSTEPAVHTAAANIREAGAQALAELRDLVGVLRNAGDDGGVARAGSPEGPAAPRSADAGRRGTRGRRERHLHRRRRPRGDLADGAAYGVPGGPGVTDERTQARPWRRGDRDGGLPVRRRHRARRQRHGPPATRRRAGRHRVRRRTARARATGRAGRWHAPRRSWAERWLPGRCDTAGVRADSGGHQMIRVIVVDDEPMVCAHLRVILGAAGDIEVAAEAHDGAEAVEAVVRHHPDIVLMDLRMPGVDGLTAIERIATLPTPPRVVALTTFDADSYVLRALHSGAAGFLLKSTPPQDLVELVRVAAAGHTVLSPAATARLVTASSTGRRGEDAQARLRELTDRELDVLACLGRGLSNADIARELSLSEATVKSYVSRMLVKIDCRNRTQAGLLAHEAGLWLRDQGVSRTGRAR